MKDAYILMLMDCNFDCLFCSVPKKEIYLSKKEIFAKIDKYAEENYNQVTLTGGEPTLHPDLTDVIKYIKTKKMNCRITTNGSNLDKKLIDDMIDAGIDYIAVSIHTFDEKLAKKISDYEDYNIKNVFSSINYILNRMEKSLYINITITKLNYKKLPEMCEIIANKFEGLNLINFNYVDIIGNVNEKNKVEEVGIQYYISELYLRKSFNILKRNNINFRVERVPMCYLVGFEEYSSDFNRLSKAEDPTTDFVDKEISKPTNLDFEKARQCEFCKYSNFCMGINKNYSKTYGTKELYPIFHNFPKEKIMNNK